MPIVLKDLADRLDSEKVRELLRQLEYPPEIRERKTDQILAEYRDHPDQPILGVESGGEWVGLIGLVVEAHAAAVIRHIVIRRDRRRQGIGRCMIAGVCRMYALRSIAAETDRDAVDFYRKCGFEIQSLGEKYPGIERFWCVRRNPSYNES